MLHERTGDLVAKSRDGVRPCRAALTVAPQVRRPCALALRFWPSRRRRSACGVFRLFNPLALRLTLAAVVVRVRRALATTHPLLACFEFKIAHFSGMQSAERARSLRKCR